MIQKIKQYKKILIIGSIIISILLILGIAFIIEIHIEKNTDVSTAIHAIVIKDNTEFKTLLGTKQALKEGTNVYILQEIIQNENKYFKVKVKNRVGKILAEDVGYFVHDDKNEYALMSDVSEFNIGTRF